MRVLGGLGGFGWRLGGSDGALLVVLGGLAGILAGRVGVMGGVMQANRHILEVFGGRLE